MIRKRTWIFGLINIFLNLTVFVGLLVLLIYLFISVNDESFILGLGDMNSEVGLFGTFTYVFLVFITFFIFVAVILLFIYLILNIIFYVKLKKEKISHTFFIVNLVINSLIALNLSSGIFIPIISTIESGTFDFIPLMFSLLALIIPSTGIIYSIFGINEYQRYKRSLISFEL